MAVLLVRAGALGDVLLLRRAVAAVRRAGQTVTLLAPASSGAALVGPGPAEVTHLIDWDRAEVSSLLMATAPGTAAPRPSPLLFGFDAALAVTRTRALVENLRRAIGRVAERDPVPPPGVHAARWYAGGLEALGLKGDDVADVPTLQATAEEAARAEPLLSRLPEKFLALHPGSGSPAKNWPADRFAALATALGWPAPWLVVGGPADAQALSAFRSRSGFLLADDLDVRILGAVLARAGLFVGNDSGVTHAAAAWGAPTLALFGPTDPAAWAPEGPRVHVRRGPDERMESLTVAAVLAAAREAARA